MVSGSKFLYPFFCAAAGQDYLCSGTGRDMNLKDKLSVLPAE